MAPTAAASVVGTSTDPPPVPKTDGVRTLIAERVTENGITYRKYTSMATPSGLCHGVALDIERRIPRRVAGLDSSVCYAPGTRDHVPGNAVIDWGLATAIFTDYKVLSGLVDEVGSRVRATFTNGSNQVAVSDNDRDVLLVYDNGLVLNKLKVTKADGALVGSCSVNERKFKLRCREGSRS